MVHCTRVVYSETTAFPGKKQLNLVIPIIPNFCEIFAAVDIFLIFSEFPIGIAVYRVKYCYHGPYDVRCGILQCLNGELGKVYRALICIHL